MICLTTGLTEYSVRGCMRACCLDETETNLLRPSSRTCEKRASAFVSTSEKSLKPCSVHPFNPRLYQGAAVPLARVLRDPSRTCKSLHMRFTRCVSDRLLNLGLQRRDASNCLMVLLQLPASFWRFWRAVFGGKFLRAIMGSHAALPECSLLTLCELVCASLKHASPWI